MMSQLAAKRSLSSGLALLLTVLACSSNSSGTTSTTGGTSSGSSGSPNCTSNNALTVTFSPMYSATDFDPAHEFQIPAVVTGVANGNVAWYGDPTIVNVTPTTAAEQDAGLGDVIITVVDAGTVTITAEVVSSSGAQSGVCGQSTLTIETCTPDQFDAGFERYFYGETIAVGDAGCAAFEQFLSGGFSGARCTNCHGATAALDFGPVEIATVQHTPEQTGGFSDTDLTNIIQHGQMPDANYFTGLDSNGNQTGLTYAEWQQFHQWTFDSTDEFQGIICFLRSLTPAPQTGAANFGRGGGQRPTDGGFGGAPDGGFGGGDGGMSRGGCGGGMGPPGGDGG